MLRITSSMTLCHRLSQLEEQGQGSGGGVARQGLLRSRRGRPSASSRTARRQRILLEEQVAGSSPTLRRSTRRGTREINTLIVGRALTGIGAFV
jgi:glutaryl-CoA dehydrogenase